MSNFVGYTQQGDRIEIDIFYHFSGCCQFRVVQHTSTGIIWHQAQCSLMEAELLADTLKNH